MKAVNWLVVSCAAWAIGCGSGDGDEGSASGTATEGTGSETATASATDSASGSTTAGSASASGGSTGTTSAGSATATGGETEGATTGGVDDGSLEFSCDGFTPPSGSSQGVMCFYDVDDPEGEPAASLSLSEVDLNGTPSVYVRLIFAPWFVDNTYGTEVIGWDNGHKFNDLVGSDHALIQMANAGEDPLLDFQLDYIHADDTAASGFRCQGIWDGEGKMNQGDEAAILAANSSLSRNLNEHGYSTYVDDSPATDADYTPNPATPAWDYRVIYEVWVDAAQFNDVDLIDACIDEIHASPAKIGDNTVEVFPDECPPGWGCFTTGDCNECPPDSSPNPDTGGDSCDPGDGFPPVP